MSGTRFVVFGEALTDFIREPDGRWRSVPGGSCWNVARAAARLGVPTGYAGGVSRDFFGDDHLRLLREAGADLRFTQQLARSPLLAMVWSSAPPRYFFVGDDSADLNYDLSRLPAGWLEAAEIVHFGCISLVREPHATRLVQVAEQVHAAGKRICLDPNYRNLMGPEFLPRLAHLAGLADYVKVSEEDLGLIFPGLAREAALARLRALAPRAQLLLTLGGEGMRLLTPERELFQPAFRVEVKDTVGAGDCSMAAWMASLLTRPDAPPEEHVRLAAAAAGVVCTRAGAYAPTRDEVEALMGAQPSP
ncbi:MAG: carbohydrate kinase [Anaeromyxobacter sp.]